MSAPSSHMTKNSVRWCSFMIGFYNDLICSPTAMILFSMAPRWSLLQFVQFWFGLRPCLSTSIGWVLFHLGCNLNLCFGLCWDLQGNGPFVYPLVWSSASVSFHLTHQPLWWCSLLWQLFEAFLFWFWCLTFCLAMKIDHFPDPIWLTPTNLCCSRSVISYGRQLDSPCT